MKNIHNNKFIRSVTDLPEFLLYKLNINSFRKKLRENKFPSVNEMYSSLGYFIVAKKLKEN